MYFSSILSQKLKSSGFRVGVEPFLYENQSLLPTKVYIYTCQSSPTSDPLRDLWCGSVVGRVWCVSNAGNEVVSWRVNKWLTSHLKNFSCLFACQFVSAGTGGLWMAETWAISPLAWLQIPMGDGTGGITLTHKTGGAKKVLSFSLCWVLASIWNVTLKGCSSNNSWSYCSV